MLELALWKAKIYESRVSINQSSGKEMSQKKMKIDESVFRNQCRISCGADNFVENVLPYLLPAAEEKSKGSAGNGGGGKKVTRR